MQCLYFLYVLIDQTCWWLSVELRVVVSLSVSQRKLVFIHYIAMIGKCC